MWYLPWWFHHDSSSEESKDRDGGKEWSMSFLRSPVEILPSTTTGRVSSIRLEINTLEVRSNTLIS